MHRVYVILAILKNVILLADCENMKLLAAICEYDLYVILPVQGNFMASEWGVCAHELTYAWPLQKIMYDLF